MTRRKRLHPRRIESVGLDANAEMIAVGWAGWWVEEGAASQTWWQGIATVHGDRLRAKWIEAAPGTRPAVDWVVRLPEWPLIERPEHFDAARKSVVIAARARIDELERELKLARAVPHRLHGEAIARAERLQEQARMVAANPHLFKAADTLSDNEWKAVRA